MVAAYPSFATPDQYAALTGTTPPPDNIQDLLDAASSTIRRYCGWHVSPVVTEAVIVDGSGGHILSLPTLRLEDVIDLTEIDQYVTTVYLSDGIEWSRNGYLRKLSGIPWTKVLRGVTANITHGFEAADTGDLAQMSITMAARASASPYGQIQQSVGQVMVRLSSPSGGSAGGVSLHPDQIAALDLYKLFGRP